MLIKDSTLRFSTVDIKDCNREICSQVIDIYIQAYGDFMGKNNAFKHITKIVYLEANNLIVACASMLGDRIRLLGVSPNYKGRGVGSKLLSTVKSEIQDSWLTAGVAHHKVIKVATKAGFKPAKNSYKIRELFQLNEESNLNQMAFSCCVDKDISFITRETDIVAFSRIKGGIHTLSYAQIVLF